MKIVRTTSTVCPDQERQITQLVADYGVAECKPMLTPMVFHIDLEKSTKSSHACIPFWQLTGSLLRIARHTHPEVMQSVIYLAQFCTCFSRDHFLAAPRVLKHLNTVKYRKRAFRDRLRAPCGAGPDEPVIYFDSDWAMGSTDRKSYSGNVL